MRRVPPVVLASLADDPLMGDLINSMARANVPVNRIDLAPAAQGADSMYETQLRSVLAELGERAIVGGYSLGGRIAAQLCPEVKPLGLLCFGYPFHRVKAPEDRHGLESLSRVRCRARVIQGTRDNHGSQAEVRGYELPDSVDVVWIEDGNHRFAPRERSGHSPAALIANVATSAAAFVESFT